MIINGKKIKNAFTCTAKFLRGVFPAVKNFTVSFAFAVKSDFLFLAEQFKIFPAALKDAFKGNSNYTFKISGAIAALFIALKNHKKMAVTLCNYFVPIFLLTAGIIAVNSEMSKTYAIEVTYNGEMMGTIKNETVYQDSIAKVGKIIMTSADGDSFLRTPVYKLVYARPSEMIDSDTLAENIISVSGDLLEDGSGLFVDGEFIGAMKNMSDIKSLLDTVEKSASEYYKGGSAEIKNDLEIKSGMYPQESMITADTLAERLIGRSLEGMQLNGYMVGGLLSVGVTLTESYTEETPYDTVEQAEEYFEVGFERIEREGKNGKRSVTASVTYLDGREVSRIILQSEIIETPVDEIKTVGSRMPDNAEKLAQIFAGKFIWPVNGGYISSNFMTEDRPTHKAMDIAAAEGTDIYAAEDGIISFAGVSDDGAGLNLILQHSDNFSTRYAHCSALYVVEGQAVVKGQIIAAVGKTGNSTGNHLHFEVRYNGYRLDPFPFVKN